MKIRKLILENFRTFYGKHQIDFSTSEKKPVTIFIGENGSGKTTLLNAIFWVFTGGTTKQFGESNILINKDAANEKASECSVEIHFDTDTHSYVLIRKSSKNNETTGISMHIVENGAYTKINDLHITNILERLMPKKLANWFIFDGEAIGYIHLNGDTKFKDELQQTFGFSSMKILNDIIHDIQSDYAREQRKQIGNEELNLNGDAIDKCEEYIELYESEIKKLRNTEEDARRDIESLEAALSKYSKAEPLQNRVSAAKRLREEHKSKLLNKINYRNELLIKTAPQLLLKNKLENLINLLHEKEIDQSLPEPFGTRLLDDIQKLEVCICGTPIKIGSDAFKKLDELRSRAATSQHIHRISLIRTQIGAYSADTNNFDRQMNQLMADIGMHESDIADQEQIIRKTDEAINQIPDEEIRKLKERLTSATGRKEQAIADIARATVRRDEQKVELSKLNNKQEVMVASLSRNTNLSKQKKKFDELSQYVSEQYARQEIEVLNALNEEVSGVLYKYLTKNFTAKVDPTSYAVRTYDIDNRLVPLSTGETNLLKFAVIAAIVGMAASRTKISKVNWITEPIIAPLIFDAPFSVVDSEYRAGIANNLTELASQLIFLFDSDKWDDEISNLMSDRVGKFYTLVSRAKGKNKDTFKNITINGKKYPLNEYNSARDESICIEVSI